MTIEVLPPFQNVAANDTAVIPNLRIGPTYNNILLTLGGTFTKAQMTEIRIILGGKLIWRIAGDEMDSIDKYYLETAAATVLHLDFSDPNAKTPFGMLVGALDTSLGYNSFQMEVDIGGATSPTLSGIADIGPPKPAPEVGEIDIRPVFRALLKATHTPGAAVTGHTLNIPLGSQQGTTIKAVHLFNSNVTAFEVTKNQLWLQQTGALAQVQALQNRLNRATQSGLFSWDPLLSNLQGDGTLTSNPDGSPANMEFRVDTSAADTIKSITDLYATVDRL